MRGHNRREWDAKRFMCNERTGENVMRIITQELREALNKNKAYRLIVNTPPPDFSALRKEADDFARWIAREHKRERASLARVGV